MHPKPRGDWHLNFPLLLLLLWASACSHAEITPCSVPVITQGQADLSCWSGDSLSLKGEWQLSYSDHDSDLQYDGVIPVPGRWSDSATKKLSAFGHARYRLDLTLPETFQGQLALILPRFNSARRVSVRNTEGKQLVLQDSGQVGGNNTLLATMRNDVLLLPDFGRAFSLIIEVSSTAGRYGGMPGSPRIGIAEILQREMQARKIIAVALSTALLIFALINVSLWLPRRKDTSPLLLAILAGCLAARTTITSNAVYDLWPSLTVHFDSVARWIAFMIAAMFAPVYFRIRYPHLVPRWLIAAPVSMSLIGFAALAFAPLIVIQVFGDYYRPVNAINATLVFILLSVGLKSGDTELRVTVLGSALLCVAFAIDITLFQLELTDRIVSFTSLAWLFFMATQTVFMSMRYYAAVQRAEKLTGDLVGMNTDLESKVRMRTAELEEKNRQLEKLAHVDPLTNVGNRRILEEAAQRELSRLDRTGNCLVIALLDLDHFKKINDKYGHNTGDEVLREAAKLLSDNLRNVDVISRWGGEEFCILFPDTDKITSDQVTVRLCELLNKKEFYVGQQSFFTSASFGLTSTQHKRPLEELIKEADQALYQAKNEGRNRVVCYWEMTEEA